MYRARAARAGPEPGSPGRFGILSTGQLRDLLQDEPKLDRIVRLSRKFQGLQLEREACLASNYALAKENLALRPRLEMGRAALAIKYQELREVAENCADKLQRLEESTHRWSPHCALGWLQAELEEAEQEAEVRGGWLGLGSRRDTHPTPLPCLFLYHRLGSPSSEKPTQSVWPTGEPGIAVHTPWPAWDSRAYSPACKFSSGSPMIVSGEPGARSTEELGQASGSVGSAVLSELKRVGEEGTQALLGCLGETPKSLLQICPQRI
ncbi:vacuolar protein sorting-associated protein 37D isoform X1 [Otolemur garnettii]|uniref:vacuolar protein sorting-associated protein 37D isoform X1 n=1 Tax=Otolemur garnettii TaxID=30611 RepID=UPI000C7F07C4|nr:vacuolar protein sorting-associated protein 37D isoform X1 [Otolemur garnettii]